MVVMVYIDGLYIFYDRISFTNQWRLFGHHSCLLLLSTKFGRVGITADLGKIRHI
jgi:hypothetical protein